MNDEQLSPTSGNSSKKLTNTEQPSRNNHRLFPVNTYVETNNSLAETKQLHIHQLASEQQAIKWVNFSRHKIRRTGVKMWLNMLLLLLFFVLWIEFRSPNGSWQSVADRINELERHNQSSSNKSITNHQKYTYLDPAKTTRVPNMTLKAFQKNAVQSYFERQQQQQKYQHQHQHQQQQPSPTSKDPTESPKSSHLRSARNLNGQNCENSLKTPSNPNHMGGISTNGSNVMRPQSLPVVSKTSASMEMLPQARLSLPNRLSQIINLTTQLAAQKQATASGSSDKLNRTQNDRGMNSPVKSTAVKLPTKQSTRPTIITVEKNNLQSINESGVPPPPPRRSNRVMPVRRYDIRILSGIIKAFPHSAVQF